MSIFGVYLLWSRTRAVNKQAEAATKQALVAANSHDDTGIERRANAIDKAIEQLEKIELGTRIHAIYKLERIAEYDSYFHWTIMEILTAFLRERWPYPTPPGRPINTDPQYLFPADKNAVLIVLGRRSNTEREKDSREERYLDLRAIDLSGTGMDDRILDRADLAYANLQNSHLERSSFIDAYFNQATLDGAKLTDANLTRAHFEDSSCVEVDFSGSNLLDVRLNGANLDGADFSRAMNLTKDQLDEACSLNGTVTPDYLRTNS